ncbi:MAG: 3-hydroxybutyrate dehydrogenase, partial [Rhodospirillaceae bacterium]|nr:3-hydroxybutyrate dehydrogenase [Rhodospirillaceae bacterium]
KAVYSSADMTRPDEIKTMVDDAIDAFGTVDILINNAGIQHVAMVDEFPIDKWDDIIAINLSSSFHTIRAALPDMKKNGWGRIINIASIHGIAASPFKSAYVAAKHGVVGLTKTVALEVAEQNITVNAICPGYVRTPLVENQIADTAKVRGISPDQVIRDVMMDRQASKKFVEINEVAAFVVFLCGDGAASITGVALPQDGGWSAL